MADNNAAVKSKPPVQSGGKSMTALLGAAFLMATSAIGPGFLTQTAKFTGEYGALFALAIITTILLDVTTQLNIWSIIGVSGMRGQDIANKVVPGLGVFIAILVSIGGLVFNIGNVGGAATGLNVMFGLPIQAGTIIGGAIGILVFLSKDAKSGMDRLTKYLGSIMIVVVLYVMLRSAPPVGEAVASVGKMNQFPTLVFPIITLLGGSCGGYITFSGAHRLLDAGYSGVDDLKQFRKSVTMGVCVSGTMRILLFLAVLGVVTAAPEIVGTDSWTASPPAAAFQAGAGNIGHFIFGMVICFAAITSIIGAAYTSVSFLKTLHPFIMKNEKWFVIGFIFVSTVIMTFLGQPATLLVLAGSVNGLILPITLAVILLASRRKDIVGADYRHPTVLLVLGVCVVLLTGYTGIKAVPTILTIFG
ncbi:NRAMP family divalent metal transporter [[Clostridium] aminophilum]|uniref:NRAMP family divalent metal transporter n=1 Tax=[Clostridium] aminophilum TaxID=1526 RepID=UPI003321BFE5